MAYGGKLTGFRFVGTTVLGVRRPLIVIATEPEDPDDDQSYTTRLDRDGNTVRPYRLRLRFKPDDLRESQLSPSIRGQGDRYWHHFALTGFDQTAGYTWTLDLETDGRAGCTGGLRAIHARGTSAQPRDRRADPATTSRLDRDGNTVAPPTFKLWTAPDDLREAEMVLAGGEEQDRFYSSWEPDFPRSGLTHTIDVETDGRAGAAGGLRALVLQGSSITDGIVSHQTERT